MKSQIIRWLSFGVALSCFVMLLSVDARAEKKIGVLFLYEQARYSEALQGIKDQLAKDGFKEPDVEFVIENAKGSKIKAAELTAKFATMKMDLLLTLGTDATLAAMKDIKDVPIVFSIVYDPVLSTIAKSWKSSGNNTTGTSFKVPMSIIMDKLQELSPVKKLAVLYTPGEKNVEAQMKELQQTLIKKRIQMVAVPLTKAADVSQLVQEAVHTTDALYLTGSSLVGASAPIIADIANQAKVITITHLEDLVEKGVLFGVCTDAYSDGRQAGVKAVQILRGAKPSSLPIDQPAKYQVIVNMKSAKAGQFQLSPDFMKKVTRTVE
jgi:putative ABC transport system substrate-binding protein